MTGPPAPGVSRRRWPLLAIGASAGTATWSGWVGLGELTGFGVVHPLPGIWDDLSLNTAVTLPVGVEAYAMFALSIATSSRALAPRVRRYAWVSSAAALALGMAGQVAYHVMTAHSAIGAGRAPWWVTALVSCLPVLVLGAASLLWHLAGSIDDPVTVPATDPIPAEVEPIPSPVGGSDPSRSPDDDPEPPPPVPVAAFQRPAPSVAIAAEPVASRAVVGRSIAAREGDVQRARAAIASGHLPATPTAAAIRTHLAISPAYARATRDALRVAPEKHDPTTPPDAEPQQQQADQQIPGQERIDLFSNHPQQPDAAIEGITDEKPLRNDPELHTYASLIE